MNQEFVESIVKRAKQSKFGLRETRSPFTIETETPEGLAMTLVKSFNDKYDLISIFTAAFNLIHERGLSNQMVQIDAEGLIRECPLPPSLENTVGNHS